MLELTSELLDFEWLEERLANRDEYGHLFLISHVPPWDETYTKELAERYKKLLEESNVSLSIHGHHHHPNEIMDNGIRYVVAGAPQVGVYRVVDADADGIAVHTMEF